MLYYEHTYDQMRAGNWTANEFELFENEARGLGVERVELQIFTHKNEDVLLYRENGYQETSIFFAKELTQAAKHYRFS